MNDPQPAAQQAQVSLPAGACEDLCRALPRAVGLAAAMEPAERFGRALLGDGGLLTVNHVHAVSAQAITLQRIWSSRPQEYPVGGRKTKAMTGWTRQLLLRGEQFVGEGPAALAEVFDDAALIASMGLRSVFNVPLLQADGSCFATFNVLGPRDHWTASERLGIVLMAGLLRPAVAAAVAPVPVRD